MTAVAEETQVTAEITPRQAGILFEAKLVQWGIEFEYVEDFELDKLRVEDWAQVRDMTGSAITKAELEEMRTQMSSGAVFPPIVVMAPDVLVDGNRRKTTALKIKRTVFPAFVAHFNSLDMAKSFAAAANQMGGRKLTPDEAHAAAATMIAMGMADEAIAREIGRTAEMVRVVRKRKEFVDRSEAAGLAGAVKTVPLNQQVKLAGIGHSPVFVEAVKTAQAVGGKASVVSELVKAAKDAASDTDAIAAIHAIGKEIKPQGAPPVKVVIPAEVKEASRYLGGLLKFAENPTVMLDTTTGDRRTESIAKWTALAAMAAQMLKLYGEQG